ncbi:MAG TPA: hypothetical protein VHL31_14040 [Geminicoccus sp.]|jgi:hypothetical protein|uniref:hypothetical protein n=1 Tax=Geminicoccus sp. TaxID=2024832 RepID=UPI002E36BA00|nr:hypothetical protein [Geminicoccus sp.]HEX2527404.1 hypothetical protein [Geminicoccus sp.]
MTGVDLVFDPLLPWWVIAVGAVLGVLAIALGIWRRSSGIGWRGLALAVVLAALAGPSIIAEERERLPDELLLVTDRSPSQEIDDRAARTDQAVAALRARLGNVTDLDVREVVLEADPDRGTALFDRLDQALGEVDRQRLAGVVVVTDGRVHDVPQDPASTGLQAPLHVLLTGRPGETDRRLMVERAPTYAMVGEPQTLTLRVEDEPGNGTAPVPLRLSINGEVLTTTTLIPGQSTEIPFRLERGGQAAVEVEVDPLEGQITAQNDRQVVFVNGVRDRLRVLLVSGQPYPGLRVWRNLLKADAAVDLVHFTILRPPEKQDGTPIRELALIAFPSRELFEEKLDQFDLVIFDRYARRGLLPSIYLDNVAAWVERGGALLEAAGPEFAGTSSLFRTPLARVLPGAPTGDVSELPFTPSLTELGRRHPVTRGLDADGRRWGRWFRQVAVDPGDATVVMAGVAEQPLLLLKRQGEGRVAQLLSDHAWLWARGYEGGGPQSLLLRRLVHWLMKEPELEEEDLVASGAERRLTIERHSLVESPHEVTVTSPSGAVQRLTLVPDATGVARAEIAADEGGLWRIDDGTNVSFASPLPVARIEGEAVTATADALEPIVRATGGTINWTADGPVPDVRRVGEGRQTAGRGWMGLIDHAAYRVQRTDLVPLMPPWLALALLLGTTVFAWWREGRR